MFLLQDYLVKQGLTTQKADALMSNVIATIDNVSYDVQLAQQFIQDQVGIDLHYLQYAGCSGQLALIDCCIL